MGQIEARIDRVETQLQAISQQLPVVGQLLTLPGVGLLTATALLAFIGDIRRFPPLDTWQATSGWRRGSTRVD